ncbi:transposase [Evansella sp. AB-rgal1]|uniref:transposase n=1 Tax=Evansella sp. AB-rgal1 TaxID=3242696 RepID=UPI00359D3E60
MGYKKRIWMPDTHYHVLNRGIRKEPLFKRNEDYEYFLSLLQKAHSKYSFYLCSYCLMKNHYHLHIFSEDNSIPRIMEYINKYYARYFNHQYNYKGRVFENRYTALPVTNERGKLNLTRYIHFNPIEAKLVKNASLYHWSSAKFYSPKNLDQLPQYLNISTILNKFHGTEINQKQQFIDWCNK